MNILYIFGNGFDKAQGMATSYPEFYSYLIQSDSTASLLLKKMQKEVAQNVELWSDMEMELGNFTFNTDDANEFYEFYFELIEKLQKYLNIENEKFTPSPQLKVKFQEDFVNPGKYIEALDKERFNNFFKTYNTYLDISVLTLNYTYSLEKILNLSKNNTQRDLGNNYKLRNIIHLHGQLDNSIIVGVDNEMQLKNESFRENDDIKDCMIKMQSNQTMKEIRHIDCKQLIDGAHLIVLFGVSLGDTDAYWWKYIGKNLIARKNIAIVQHLYNPEAVPLNQQQKRGRLERKHQQLLMQKMGIEQENWTEEIKNRLFFTLNKPIFKL